VANSLVISFRFRTEERGFKSRKGTAFSIFTHCILENLNLKSLLLCAIEENKGLKRRTQFSVKRVRKDVKL
jgi:hypothetical protein